MTRAQQENKSLTQARLFASWGCVTLFYFWQYILRVVPGIAATDLRQDFRISAEEFSTLSSFYLYIYALLQIPVGLLIDRVGIRRMAILSCTLCVCSAFMLSWAPTLPWAQAARVFLGIGSASAFTCCLTAISRYFPAKQQSVMMGLVLTAGSLGPITAGHILPSLIESLSWRTSIAYLGAMGAAILLLLFLGAKFPSRTPTPTQAAHISRAEIICILRNPFVYVYTFLAIGLYTPLTILADLWGPIFLMEKYHITRAQASSDVMLLYVGLSAGSLILGWFAERWHVFRGIIQIASLMIIAGFAYIVYGPTGSHNLLLALLFFTGFFCGSEMLCFLGVSRSVPTQVVATALGLTNTFNMLAAGVLQHAIGAILDIRWTDAVDACGIKIYSAEDYQAAFLLLIGILTVNAIVSFCQPKRALT